MALIAALSRLYEWGLARRLVANNSAAGITKDHHHPARDRVLNHDEIKRFWSACDAVGWPAGPLFKLLLLTGQREAEIGGLCWSELDLDKRQLNLLGSRTENGKAHTVHLSEMAMAIIGQLPRVDGCDYVFGTTGRGPFRSYKSNRQHIQKLMGAETPDFVTQDLRRTATTLMAELRIAPHVADKVLNHTGGGIRGVAAVFDRFQYLAERKAALDALGRFISALIGRDQGNVAPLRSAAAE
jgi:integrase